MRRGGGAPINFSGDSGDNSWKIKVTPALQAPLCPQTLVPTKNQLGDSGDSAWQAQKPFPQSGSWERLNPEGIR
jgi:hypothetical protein